MTRISRLTVKEMPEKQLVTIRRTIDFFAEYSEMMDEVLQKIDKVLTASKLLPASGPIVCFHNVDLAALDVEIGMEIAFPVVLKESEVQCKTIPARKIALTIDQGPYEEQDPTLEALMAWINEQGYSMVGGIYYHYLNDEEQLPKEYLTEMYIPINMEE